MGRKPGDKKERKEKESKKVSHEVREGADLKKGGEPGSGTAAPRTARGGKLPSWWPLPVLMLAGLLFRLTVTLLSLI
jgi:hypothetical protein